MVPLLISSTCRLFGRLTTLRAKASYATGKFENQPYDLHKITSSPPVNVELTREDALNIYTHMVTIRRMENTAGTLYQQKIILGFCHLYSGQEACAVGVKAVMRPQDSVITSYRCHAWAYLMGIPLESIMAELCGKVTGSSRGKGGSMHIYSKNFYGGNGIVGAHVSLGTGIALAKKYRNDGGISFTVMGDGAVDNGQVSESFNFAMLHKLPIVYVIENNNFSMGTAANRHSANTDYFTRGDSIPGIRTDGMDVLSVREASKFAVEHVEDGKGPIVLELVTYRYYGHSMSDPGTSYRTRDEVKEVREHRDCIRLINDKILKSELAKEDELKRIDNVAKDVVDKAVEKAMQAKPPSPEEVSYDVYKNYKGKFRFPAWKDHRDHKNVAAAK